MELAVVGNMARSGKAAGVVLTELSPEVVEAESG